MLAKAHNTAFAKLLVQRAHAANLAIAQKNTSELAPIGVSQIGFDFAIVEECQVWSECEAFTDVYGNQVYEIEYNDNDRDADGNPVDPISFFNAACSARGSKISIIYRDRDGPGGVGGVRVQMVLRAGRPARPQQRAFPRGTTAFAYLRCLFPLPLRGSPGRQPGEGEVGSRSETG